LHAYVVGADAYRDESWARVRGSAWTPGCKTAALTEARRRVRSSRPSAWAARWWAVTRDGDGATFRAPL